MSISIRTVFFDFREISHRIAGKKKLTFFATTGSDASGVLSTLSSYSGDWPPISAVWALPYPLLHSNITYLGVLVAIHFLEPITAQARTVDLNIAQDGLSTAAPKFFYDTDLSEWRPLPHGFEEKRPDVHDIPILDFQLGDE